VIGTDKLDWISGIWWRRIPRALAHLSSYLWAVATDGLYLVLWPRVGAFATPLCLALGAFIGGTRLGFHTVFAESIPLMLFVIALGLMSAHLGAAFLIGFAAGEYGSTNAAYGYVSHPSLARLSHLVQYGVMAVMLVTIPVIAKYLVGDLTARLTSNSRWRLAVAVVAYPVTAVALALCWSKAIPQLIRPSYIWTGRSLPAHPLVMELPPGETSWLVHQFGAWPLVIGVACLAALARIGVQLYILKNERLARAFDEAADRVQVRAPAWTSGRSAQALQVIARPLWLTLLLAGMYDYGYRSDLSLMSVWQPILIFVSALVLSLIRYLAIPFPPVSWGKTVARVPLIARLLLAMAVLYPLADVVIRLTSDGRAFTPIVITVVLSLVLFHVVSPNAPPQSSSQAA
jgi:hypothetical protein